jgi:hypothetical protein
MPVTWVEARKNPANVKFVVKKYESFLSQLDVHLKGQALKSEGEVKLVYVQKPVQIGDSLTAHGVVKVGNNEYPFKACLDLETGWVDVKSKVFRVHFKVTKWLEDMHLFKR